jgi:hypothetical protein
MISSRASDKELKLLKPSLVAVVDFRPPDGASLVQGHYLAWVVSTILAIEKKKKFAVADHGSLDADLARLHLTPQALVPGDSLRAAAPRIGADFLVIGTIEKRGTSYLLEITPVRVSNSETFAPLSATFESTEFFESMLTPSCGGSQGKESRSERCQHAILYPLSRSVLHRSRAAGRDQRSVSL